MITVGIPCKIDDDYNLKFFELSVQSVKEQTYKDFEIVVVDDGSSKDKEILSICENHNARYIRHPVNLGIGAARQSVVDNAKGEWICYLSHDDLFNPKKLEIHMDIAQKHPQAIQYSDYINIDEDGNNMHYFTAPAFSQISEFAMACWAWAERSDMFVNFSTVFAPKSAFEKLPWDKTLKASEDLLWVLCAAKMFNFIRIQPALIKYRRHTRMTTAKRSVAEIQNTAIKIRETARKFWEEKNV